MTTNDLRAAAERLRIAACDPGSPIYGSDLVPLIDDVTAAILAEHRADDDEPANEEWLRSAGGDRNVSDGGYWYFNFTIDINEEGLTWLRIHQPDSDGDHPTEVYSRNIDGTGMEGVGLVRSWCKTRRDVRLLCRALGIALKEQE